MAASRSHEGLASAPRFAGIMALVMVTACQSSSSNGAPASSTAASERQRHAAAPAAAALPCCESWDEVRRADGQRVIVEGVYEPTHVVKRGKESPAELETRHGEPQTVQLRLDSGLTLMLGIYYTAQGRRPAGELERLSGERVRVTGVLHQRTPSQAEGESVMQTMIGPYVTVESIVRLDAPPARELD